MLAILVMLLAGCANTSKDLAPSYVSPLLYKDYTCEQMSEEIDRINQEASKLATSIDKRAKDDKWQAAGGLLFWPVFFAVGDNDAQNAEYSRLRGEALTIQQVAVLKDCDELVAELQAMEAEAEEEIGKIAEEEGREEEFEAAQQAARAKEAVIEASQNQ